MPENWTKDIYLKLLGDLIGEKLTDADIYEPILHYENKMKDSRGESINKLLVESCDDLKGILKTSEICVGAQHGYVEPCPISYTGRVITGNDKFYTVFIGLNPHLETPKEFPPGTTLADLANLHHPDDIIYNREEYRKNIDNDIFINNYWRVFGNIEGKSKGRKWSSYYKTVLRVHLALISEYKKDNVKIWSIFKGDRNDIELTNEILRLLKKFPMANAEFIPYKSQGYNMNNFSSIFDKKRDSEFVNRYIKYFQDIWGFIDKHSRDDAYIIIPTNYSSNTSSKQDNLDKVYDIIKCQVQKMHGSLLGEKYIFKKDNGKEEKGELILYKKSNPYKDKEKYKTSPMYLCKWIDNKGLSRKVIITASLSGRGIYNWIYLNFGHGWIDALKEHYNQP